LQLKRIAFIEKLASIKRKQMKKIFIILGCTILCLASCTNPKQEKSTLKYVDEPHSYAQPNEAVITHLDLDIDVDFDQEILKITIL
jgi:hypothetical protein